MTISPSLPRKDKKNTSSAFSKNVRCQKCLKKGHWTFECRGKRKQKLLPKNRNSRNEVMTDKDGECSKGNCKSSNNEKKRSCPDGDCETTSDSDYDRQSKSKKPRLMRKCIGGKCVRDNCGGGDSSSNDDSESSQETTDEFTTSESDSESSESVQDSNNDSDSY